MAHCHQPNGGPAHRNSMSWSVSDGETSGLLGRSSVTFCHFPGYVTFAAREICFLKVSDVSFLDKTWKEHRTHTQLSRTFCLCSLRRRRTRCGRLGEGSRPASRTEQRHAGAEASLSRRSGIRLWSSTRPLSGAFLCPRGHLPCRRRSPDTVRP